MSVSYTTIDFDQKQIQVVHGPISEFAHVKRIAEERSSQDDDRAFYLFNLDKVVERHSLWKKLLPRVEIFYAVKSNTDSVLLRMMTGLGTGFDCASQAELELILGMGVDPSRIIFAHPCKSPKFIQFAKTNNVALQVFDSVEELEKTHEIYPDVELILRIKTVTPERLHASLKFGADLRDVEGILKRASELEANVVGACFHVGFGCTDAHSYWQAIEQIKKECPKSAKIDPDNGTWPNCLPENNSVFDIGTSFGLKMNVVDLGFGFPGVDYPVNGNTVTLDEIVSSINSALEVFFPDPSIRVIAEPGRFFSASPFTLCANIMHRTSVPANRITLQESDSQKAGMMYYLNVGTYCALTTNLVKTLHSGAMSIKTGGDLYDSVLWGPCGDYNDRVDEHIQLPLLHPADWLMFPNRGAYSTVLSTTFNGFPHPDVIYIASKEAWSQLEQLLKPGCETEPSV